MANRTSVKSNIVTKNVPTVTNAILTDMLNADMNDNLKFREDVAVSQSSGVSNINLDFTGKDRIDLTRTGGSLNLTASGIGDGETVFLLITKTVGQAITWTNVTDVTPVKENVTALSIVIYEIVRKASYYFARAWVESPVQGTDSVLGIWTAASQIEHNALSSTTKLCVPGRLPLIGIDQYGLSKLSPGGVAQMGQDTDLIPNQSVVRQHIDYFGVRNQDSGSLELKLKTFESLWNMDTSTTISIIHGLGSNWLNIIGLTAVVYDNTRTGANELNGTNDGGTGFMGRILANGTNIIVERNPFGLFDNANFNNALVKIGVLYYESVSI